MWTPTYVEGLAVTLDYYEIEIEDVISSVSASRLIENVISLQTIQMFLSVMLMRDLNWSLKILVFIWCKSVNV